MPPSKLLCPQPTVRLHLVKAISMNCEGLKLMIGEELKYEADNLSARMDTGTGAQIWRGRCCVTGAVP